MTNKLQIIHHALFAFCVAVISLLLCSVAANAQEKKTEKVSFKLKYKIVPLPVVHREEFILAGIVTDASFHPLPGAKIYNSHDRNKVVNYTTDEKGRFFIKAAVNDTLQAGIKSNVSEYIVVKDNKSLIIALKNYYANDEFITNQSKDTRITGTVTASNEIEYLWGVKIKNLTSGMEVYTSLYGYYEINSSPGDRLLLTHPGFLDRMIMIDKNNTVNLSLYKDLKTNLPPFKDKEVIITGLVFDESGLPAVGMVINIKGRETIAVTDFDGRFIITADRNDTLLINSFSSREIKIKVRSLQYSNSIKVNLQSSTPYGW